MGRSNGHPSGQKDERISRRLLLRAISAGGLGVVGASLFAACGGGATTPTTAPGAAPTVAKAGTAPTTAPAAPTAPTTAPAATSAPATTTAPAVATTAPATSAGTPKTGGTLVHDSGYEADTLDPARTTNGEALLIITNLMDGLVNFARDSVKVEPAVAKSWDISEDGKQYTFHLRDGVTFHDGTPCDADAIKFNFDRIMDSKNPYHKDDMAFAQSSLLGPVDTVAAPDPATIVLTLKDPYGPLLNVLATAYLRFGSPKAIKADPDGFGTNPVGNGPFKFTGWTRKAHVDVARNDAYWDQKSYLDKVIFKYVPESSVRLSELQTGAAQVFDSIGVHDVAQVKSSPQLVLQELPYPAILYAYLNFHLPPTDKLQVRQALSYAINYEGIVKGLFNGLGQLPVAGPLMPGLVGYQTGLNPYTYDPTKAKSLLGEAGLSGGTKLSMVAYNYQRPYAPAGGDQVAQAIQANLKQVGIDLDLQILDAAPYKAIANDPAKRPNILLGGWYNDYPDQDEFMFDVTESSQPLDRGFWKDDAYDKLVIQARQISDQTKRAELYQQAAKIYLANAAQLVISYGVATSVLRKEVQNAVLTPLATWRFDRIWLSG